MGMKSNPKKKALWKLTPGVKPLKSMRVSKGNITWWSKWTRQNDWSDDDMMTHCRRALGEKAALIEMPLPPKRKEGAK